MKVASIIAIKQSGKIFSQFTMLCVAFLKSGPGGAVKKEKLLLNASQNLKIFTIIGK